MKSSFKRKKSLFDTASTYEIYFDEETTDETFFGEETTAETSSQLLVYKLKKNDIFI